MVLRGRGREIQRSSDCILAHSAEILYPHVSLYKTPGRLQMVREVTPWGEQVASEGRDWEHERSMWV